MAKKLYSLDVRGKQHEWGFHIYADPKHVEDWRADGLEVYEICNVVPVWIVDMGLLRVWCFFQDIFHFKNPFESKDED